MGKPTGFMDYERQDKPAESPLERIKHFNEFHTPLSKEEQELQGARCMACGVPFCQSGKPLAGMASGCPLHNLVPEWNDLIYNGNWKEAYLRLKKTNNFPEFTSRVCPALCENACTCGLNQEAVASKSNEYAIIENAYEMGYAKANPPKVRTGKKVAVIGSGPSGLAAADLLKKYDRVILACGASNPRDIKVPGRDAQGIYFAVDFLKSTTKALWANDMKLKTGSYISAKGKNVIVIGGGDTGNDCVGTSIRHGAKNVLQLEMMPKAPDERTPMNPWPEWPRVCKTDYGQQEAIAVFGSDPRVYTTTVKEFVKDKKGNLCKAVLIKLESKTDEKTGRKMMVPVEGSEYTVDADLVLIAAGFLGSQDYVTKAFGVEVNERTNVKTEAGKYSTNVKDVFTAGDMHRGQSLVVWAIREGREVAREVDESLMGYTNLYIQ